MRDRARTLGEAVEARAERLGYTTRADLARAAGVDADTLATVISGRRFPTAPSRAKLEPVLRWPDGTMVGIRDGDVDPAAAVELDDVEPGRTGWVAVPVEVPRPVWDDLSDPERTEAGLLASAAVVRLHRELRGPEAPRTR